MIKCLPYDFNISLLFQIPFRMERDWQCDLDYSELVYSFVLRRQRRAKAVWEDVIEKGLPSLGGWSDTEMLLLNRLRQWVRSSLSFVSKRANILNPSFRKRNRWDV